MGEQVTLPLLSLSYESPCLGEHGEERVGMFVRLLAPSFSTRPPQSKAEMGKTILAQEVAKATQGTAAPSQETTS